MADRPITRNAVRCNNCGDEIESIHVHDFRWCRCGQVGVDGGRDYLRRAWHDGGTFTELSTHFGETP